MADSISLDDANESLKNSVSLDELNGNVTASKPNVAPTNYGFGEEVGDIATAGLTRQAGAGLDAVTGKLFGKGDFGDLYREGLGSYDKAQEDYRKAHPGSRFAADAVGLLAGAPGKAIGAVREAPDLVRAIISGAKGGAGYGAVSGASGSDLSDPGKAAMDTAEGTLKGTAAGIAGAGISRAVPAAVKGGLRTVGSAFSKAGTEAEDKVRQLLSGHLSSTSDEEAKAAAEYAKKQASATKALTDLESQPATAEARATKRALRSKRFISEREAVLDDLRNRSRALEEDAQRAGASVEEAKAVAATHEAKVGDAEIAADDLEKKLLATPTMDAESFGKELRASTKQLAEKYGSKRAAASGFKQAISTAGADLRVPTDHISAQIDDALKGVRNPQLESTLKDVQGLLKTDGQGSLSVKSADSLRGYLDAILSAKSVGERKIDRETMHELEKVKSGLLSATTDAWTPYKDAMIKWRELSRPLDIVERNGALKHVLDTDPLSSDYKLTEAQVVQSIISKAKSGNPVFSRLLEESPGLRDSARLAFAEDLFGQDVAPTEARFQSWLKSNARPLKQLGLFDEFKGMREAQASAKRAVSEAKGVSAESKAHAQSLDKAEKAATDKMRKTLALRKTEAGRVSEVNKSQASAEKDRSKNFASRAKDAASRLSAEQQTAAAAQEKHAKLARELTDAGADLARAPAGQIESTARGAVRKLRSNELIDQKQYDDAMREIDRAAALHGETQAAKARLMRGLYYILGTGAAVGVAKEVGGFVNAAH